MSTKRCVTPARRADRSKPPQARGADLRSKKGFEAALSLLRAPGSVGVLVDQSAGDGGIWMPFFKRLRFDFAPGGNTGDRTNAAVVPSAVHTAGFAKWRVVFEEEIPYDPANPEQLTADINSVLERQIRQSPADWFWVHNRWKARGRISFSAKKTGGLLAGGHEGGAAVSLWLPCSLAKLACRRRHEPEHRACFQAWSPGRPAPLLTPAKFESFWKSTAEIARWPHSPCFLRECPLDFRRMRAVATEEAAKAILALFR